MSTPAKPNIKPIDFAGTARMIEEFATNRNIPTKQYPVDAAAQPPKERGGEVAPVVRAKVSRPATRKLTLNLPDYLIDALNMKSAQTKTTSRHIVMRGLRSIGFTIRDEDMPTDGRRAASL